MYLEHFGFHRLPFTIAPDPELLFPSRSHQEALAHLHYALTGHGGLVSLTGEVGTGKTTLCRAFLSNLPRNVRSAYVFNPQLSANELLQSICDEFGIAATSGMSQKELYRVLNDELLKGYAAGQRFICIIDEAQSMPAPLLEQVRLLTNLETDREKLLTVILVGQPELRQLLARHDLRQLNQRITARYHLPHLSFRESAEYLRFRCQKAGVESRLFSKRAIWSLWRYSQGIPRLLNSLADRSLLGAYATGKQQVGISLVRGASQEVLPLSPPAFFKARMALLCSMLLALSLWAFAPQITSSALLNFIEKTGVQNRVSVPAPESNNPVQLLSQHMALGEFSNCVALLERGWHCMWLEWPIERLRQLQVPVLVQTYGTDNNSWVLLSNVTSDVRYVRQALLIWKPPAQYVGQLIRPGERHDVVAWLRNQLNMNWTQEWQVIGPQGNQRGPDTQYYDLLLAQAVENFQRQYGLNPDRIVGPDTVLMLWQQGRN